MKFLEFHGKTGNYLYICLNFQKEIAGKIAGNFFSGTIYILKTNTNTNVSKIQHDFAI